MMLVSKVLMAIANGAGFGGKEEYLAPLNKFVQQQRGPLFQLLTDLAAVCHPLPSSLSLFILICFYIVG